MRIGIFRSCGIGDGVQLTPLLQQIAADYPGAGIDLFTSENVRGIFAGHPHLSRCITLPTDLLLRQGTPRGCWQVWRTVARAGTWDLFINLESQWRRSFFFWLVRTRRSAGVVTGRKPWRRYTYEQPVFHTGRLAANHTALGSVRLWESLTGFPDRGFGYDIGYLRRPDAALPPGVRAPFVCLAPGAGNFGSAGEFKRWPASHWGVLADRLQAAGYQVVWLGAPADRDMVDALGGKVAGIDLIGRVSLDDTIQLLARSRGMVGNDSGLFHAAIGLDVPAVGFYGPTNPVQVGPFRARRALVLQKELPCVPCGEDACRVQDPSLAAFSRPYCLHLLTPETVAPRILEFLAGVALPEPEPVALSAR